MATTIPTGPGDKQGPPPLPDPPSGEMTTPQKILTMMKDYAVGAIKGVTTDLAGTPVDLINLVISPVTQALGIYSDKPVGGSKDLRERAGVGVEDANLRETAGNLLTPGGVAHAMIVGAARVGRDVQGAGKMMNQLVAEGKSIQEAAGRTFAETGVYIDKTDKFKTVISDAGVKIKSKQVYPINNTFQLVTQNSLSSTIDAPELFKAYPELKKVGITTTPGKATNSAAYYADEWEPYITIAQGSSPEQLRKTLLHEIQHAVQDIENFAFKGSNPKSERKFSEAAAKKLNEKAADIKAEINKKSLGLSLDTLDEIKAKIAGHKALQDRFELDRQQAYPKYRNNPGEQEATFTGSTANDSLETLGQKVLTLIRQGRSPQSWDMQKVPTRTFR